MTPVNSVEQFLENRAYDLSAPIGGLTARLGRLLKSVDMIGWLNGATSGRFDVRRASRMLAGSERVFKSRWEKEATTTAVSIMIDMSGSMSKHKGAELELAAQCAWAIANAVERSDCMVEVMGFGASGNSWQRRDERQHSDGTEDHKTVVGVKFNTATVKMIKPFGAACRTREILFRFLSRVAGGGTPDYHAVRTMVDRLALMPADRKVAIVLTDGMGDVALMKKFCGYSQSKHGIPVLGIGIQVSPYQMEHAYDVFACVNKVEDLAKTAVGNLIKQIEALPTR